MSHMARFVPLFALRKGSRNVTSHNVVPHKIKGHHEQLDASKHVWQFRLC